MNIINSTIFPVYTPILGGTYAMYALVIKNIGKFLFLKHGLICHVSLYFPVDFIIVIIGQN